MKITIGETEYNLENGEKGKLSVFFHNGNQTIIRYAIDEYHKPNGYRIIS